MSQEAKKIEEAAKEGLEQFLQEPYPEDIFPAIPQKQYDEIHKMLLEKFNMPIDRLAAHIGRALRKPLKKYAEDILKQQSEAENNPEDDIDTLSEISIGFFRHLRDECNSGRLDIGSDLKEVFKDFYGSKKPNPSHKK